MSEHLPVDPSGDETGPERPGRWSGALQDWVHLANILAVVVALVTLGFGAYQLRQAARTNDSQFALQREIAANESWSRFMELSMEHPEFTSAQSSYVVDTSSFSEQDKRIYPWFVQYALFSGEQVLSFAANDPEWNYTIEAEAVRHKAYIESPQFLESELCSYSADLRRLVSRISDKVAAANAGCAGKLGMGASKYLGSLQQEAR